MGLKLYRLKSESASYDEAREIVVWAESEDDALAVLAEAFVAESSPPGAFGSPANPYGVTRVKRIRGVVLAETSEG